jgi:hypothetical protein
MDQDTTLERTVNAVRMAPDGQDAAERPAGPKKQRATPSDRAQQQVLMGREKMRREGMWIGTALAVGSLGASIGVGLTGLPAALAVGFFSLGAACCGAVFVIATGGRIAPQAWTGMLRQGAAMDARPGEEAVG